MSHHPSLPAPTVVTMRFALQARELSCRYIEGDIAAITGFGAEEFLSGKRCFTALFYADAEDVAGAIFSHKPQTTPRFLTWHLLHKNGAVRVIHCTYLKQPVADNYETEIVLTLQLPDAHNAELKHAQEAWLASEARLSTAMDFARVGYWELPRDGANVLWSEHVYRLYGIPADFPAGVETLSRIIHPDDFPAYKASMASAFSVGTDHRVTFRIYRHDDGSERWIDCRGRPVAGKDGSPEKVVGFIQDITEHKHTKEALRLSETRYHAAFHGSNDAMVLGRLQDSVIIDVNQAFLDDYGAERAEVLGRTTLEINIWHDLDDRQHLLESLQRKGYCNNLEARFLRKDGSSSWGVMSASLVEVDNDPCIFAITRDITERKHFEEKIHQLAYYDHLTSLPNRTLLRERIMQVMEDCAKNGRHGALLLIDLDNFKALNDTLGHDMGDVLLQQVAQRLTDCVSEKDTVARLGGDEFVVLLADLSEIKDEAIAQVEQVGRKFHDDFRQNFQLKGITSRITPSIGASIFCGGSEEVAADELIKQADLAMYRVKDMGRNSIRFFEPEMELAAVHRAKLESELREAIENKQFVLHYQPQVAGNEIVGVEALVRWERPARGLVSPADFIPLVEENGLILPLGQWILETACQQLKAWAKRTETAHLTIAVNVSVFQFRQADFVERVLAVLENTCANPQRLKLELTESLLAADLDEVAERMFALKAKGVGFALDDFGTGYSSLSYMKQLPLDHVKIDRTFVRDVLIDPNDMAIVKTIIALAQSMGLGVIAEGVETASQRDFLADSGCHAYQGYFFSRPLPIEDFEKFALQATLNEAESLF